MTSHLYGISVLVTQKSFCEGSSGGPAKCRLFSQAMQTTIRNAWPGKSIMNETPQKLHSLRVKEIE